MSHYEYHVGTCRWAVYIFQGTEPFHHKSFQNFIFVFKNSHASSIASCLQHFLLKVV